LRLKETDIEDLTGKSFRIIINNGKDGIVQSKLWKELDLNSRDGSRVAIRLEERALIKRERFLDKGRWTYKLFPTKLPIDTKSIELAPCLGCPVEHMCSTDGTYSPNNCSLVEDWIMISFNERTQLQPGLNYNIHRDHEPVQRENQTNERRVVIRVSKNNKKIRNSAVGKRQIKE
jgi:hypothetical protein